ncbi:MAG: Stp1/IreP family PP2C-type Ser/Thr phosphatase [Epulopiscium sp.]|nr:Stp1/IreP family PP2C-type Ser/Thr phosphatase [Candidatus Epulonipiscium sp.]
MISAGKCHIGKHRNKNEDAIFLHDSQYGCLPNLYIVADGMGGHLAGEYASTFAIQSFCEYVNMHKDDSISAENLKSFLYDAILYTNNKVYEKSKEDDNFKGMGTTFIVSVFLADKIYVAHVGDSRVYIIQDDKIYQLTLDHSYVEEMVRKGEITEKEAINHPNRNIITRAVGTNSTVDVDFYTADINDGTFTLMCSDGLSNMLEEEEILHIIKENEDLETITQALVDKANEKGGFDNISVIIIRGREGR